MTSAPQNDTIEVGHALRTVAGQWRVVVPTIPIAARDAFVAEARAAGFDVTLDIR